MEYFGCSFLEFNHRSNQIAIGDEIYLEWLLSMQVNHLFAVPLEKISTEN